MSIKDEELPPPYAPPVTLQRAVPVIDSNTVPRWIVIYAVVGKPLLWFLHRVANGFAVFDERGKESFYGLIVMVAIWSLGSLVVVAIVYAGGVHTWAKPTDRPRLLRFGLGCSLAWNVMLVALVILALGAFLAGQQTEENQFGGQGDIVAGVAGLVWIASLVIEWLAWCRLGGIGVSAQKK